MTAFGPAPSTAQSLTVSIITPVHNMGWCIEDCLDSIRSQTYQPIEHIVVDNCSTDDSATKIGSYLGTYNLIYLREPDQGQADAINKGLDRAHGDIIAWLNADDYYATEKAVETVMAIFNTRSNISVVAGQGYLTDREKRSLRPFTVCQNPRRLLTKDGLLQPSTFWRKNKLRLDTTYCYAFDWVFFIELYRTKASFAFLEDHLSVYRIYTTNKTGMNNAARKREICRVLAYYNGRFAPNTLWCCLIYWLFSVAEKTGWHTIKRFARIINKAAEVLTGGRIVSS